MTVFHRLPTRSFSNAATAPVKSGIRAWRVILAVPMVGALLAVAAPSPAAARLEASIVIDPDSGAVVQQVNPDARGYPASLTKMMTLYLTFDAMKKGRLRLDQELPVSAHAQRQSPSKLGLTAGSTIQVENAILALCTKSANDAAVVLAEAIGGTESEFAELMTQKAHALGMSRSQFRNASGLPNDGQFTTVRDMATLAQALIRDWPQHYHYFSRASFTYNGINHRNHNHLMERYSGMDGLKTGYIGASGFNLAASAVRNGRRLIGVVFGGATARSRDRHMAQLLDDAFAHSHGTDGDRARMLVASAEAAAEPPALPPRKPELEAGDADEGDDVAPAPQILQVAMVAPPVKPAPKSLPLTRSEAKPVWGIQFGTFPSRKAGQRAANQASGRLLPKFGETKSLIIKANAHRKTGYHAVLIGLDDEAEARAACAKLASRVKSCSAVPPSRL
ncbi:MAG: D-alanyl-D-alanine carboxypeptidase [Azospirillum sp.]|nr:D-alanyl-D-alanine carboxypeptidase [Azospirillum sp.]